MTTTTTTGQNITYSTDPEHTPKRKTVIFYIIGICIAIFFLNWLYRQGVKEGKNQQDLINQKEQVEAKISDIRQEKEVIGNTEREKSKSSVNRAKIIREGVIRDLPVIRDTTREAKHKWIIDLTHKMKNKKD